MLDFAQVALAEIEVQRSELMDPLNQQEQEVLAHLAESYAQLQQAQAQVTAYLSSAQDVTRSQDEAPGDGDSGGQGRRLRAGGALE